MARPTDPDDEGDLDDEALRWAGDEEQGRARPRLAERGVPTPETFRADEEDPFGDAPRDVPGAVSAFVSGVLYLAVTVGWIYSVQLTSAPSTQLFSEIAWQFGEFTAMVAAPIWFAAVMTLTRGRLGLRLGWFALGLGLLLPWPVLLELAG